MHARRTGGAVAALAIIPALLLAGCASPSTAPVAAPTAAAQEEVVEPAHWSYAGTSGPSAWSGLDAKNATCSAGGAQSPIDLPAKATDGASAPLALHAEEAEGELEDTGHTVQLKTEDAASTVEFEGTRYELQQLHFHTPAEHLVDGHAAAAELHLVHAAADGRLLVVGVLAEEGAASKAWQPYLDAVAAGPEDDVPFDVAAMLPTSKQYLTYTGSLTTPPCTEGVTWVVLTDPVELSAAQLATLKHAYDGTARPVQPLDSRSVRGGTADLD